MIKIGRVDDRIYSKSKRCRLFLISLSLLIFGAICIITAAIASNSLLITKFDVINVPEFQNSNINSQILMPDYSELKDSFEHAKKIKNYKNALVSIECAGKVFTGMIISSDGYVISDNCVLKNPNNCVVITNSQRRYKAKFIGVDTAKNVALLKIEAKDDFSFFKLSDARKAQIGDWSISIGEPLKLIEPCNFKNSSKSPPVITESKNLTVATQFNELNEGKESQKTQTVNNVSERDSDNNAKVNRFDSGEEKPKQFVNLKEIEDSYKQEILKKIDSNKIYPPVARRLGHSGRVLVSFVIYADGEISEPLIIDGSKYQELKSAAIEAIKRSAPFNPIPSELNIDKLDISIWINFELLK